MKPISILVFTLVLMSFSLMHAEVFFEEDFEGQFPGSKWQISGEPTWSDWDYTAHEGGYAAWCAGTELNPYEDYYTDNMEAVLTCGPLNLGSRRSATLSFWAIIDCEESYDYLAVFASTRRQGYADDAEILRLSGPNGLSWQPVEVALDEYLDFSPLYLKFVFISDSSESNYEGVWLDEIMITDAASAAQNSDPYEPNDSVDEAFRLVFTSQEQTIQAHLNNDQDEDWFEFEGRAGREYLIESSGDVDVMASLFNRDASMLFGEDDDGAGDLNFSISLVPESTAIYKLRVSAYPESRGNYGIRYSYTEYDLSSQDEDEINNSAIQATRLNVGPSQRSRQLSIHYPRDVDWYVFSAEAGRVYTFESQGDVDLVASIVNPINEEFLREDDDGGEDFNFLLSFVTPESYDYYLKISSLDNAVGDYVLQYSYKQIISDNLESNDTQRLASRLTVTSAEQSKTLTLHSMEDVDWFRFNAVAGRLYEIHSTGDLDLVGELYSEDSQMMMQNDDCEESANFRIMFDPPASGNYYLKVYPYEPVTGEYGLSYSYSDLEFELNRDRYEPDSWPHLAKEIQINTTESSRQHNFHYSGDQDWLKFTTQDDHSYEFYSSGNLDTVVRIYDADGLTVLTEDDDGGNDYNYKLDFAPPASGTYYVVSTPLDDDTGEYAVHYRAIYNPGDDYEPDNSPRTATSLRFSHSLQHQAHSIHRVNDADWFVMDLQAGREYSFYTDANFDSVGYIYWSDGESEITMDDDSNGGTNFRINFSPSESGRYYLMVNGYDGAVGDYTLHYE